MADRRPAAFLLAGLVALGIQPQPDRSALLRPVFIVGGTLIDGTGAPPRRNEGILVEKGRFRIVGSEALKRAPRDARTIEASDKWIVPGFIDGHVHFFQTGGLDARPDVVPNPNGVAYRDVVGEIRRAPQKYPQVLRLRRDHRRRRSGRADVDVRSSREP